MTLLVVKMIRVLRKAWVPPYCEVNTKRRVSINAESGTEGIDGGVHDTGGGVEMFRRT